MPLSKTHQRAWAALLGVQGKLVREIDQRLAAAGVASMGDYDALLILEDEPERRLRLHELSDRLLLTRSGITRLVDRLAERGLVERIGDPADRRALYARLTEKGFAERERAWPAYRAAIAELFAAHMTEAEARAMGDVLERILNSRPKPPLPDPTLPSGGG